MAWQSIKGHDALIEGFRRVVRRGRLAHAYLFTGPRGVGKHSFAREFAKALLCESGRDDFEACDICPACKQVEASTHPDFFPAAKPEDVHEFPIDLIRELCKSFSLRSARGRGKVVVIDDADDLNQESANCFLKTLEEPPPRSVIILIGSSPERQLPTIVSRCQVVRFGALPPDVVDEILQKQGVEDPLRRKLVRLANGSPGNATELSDPSLWEFRKQFLAGLCANPVDVISLSRLWFSFVEQAGKETALQRARASLVVRLIIDVLDDAVSVRLGGPARRTEEEDRPLIDSLTRGFSPEALLELIDRCLEADAQIERRAQLILVLEALVDAWARGMAGRARAG